MTMQLNLSGFQDQDLEDLADTYNRLAERDDVGERWQAWSREVAEGLRLELASRMIARAWAEDPAAMAWYGRLTPPSPP